MFDSPTEEDPRDQEEQTCGERCSQYEGHGCGGGKQAQGDMLVLEAPEVM